MTTGNYRSSGFLTRRALPFLVTCLLPLFPGLGNAQEQQATGTQPAPDKNAAEMSSHEAPATFKAKVNLVLVPVVVLLLLPVPARRRAQAPVFRERRSRRSWVRSARSIAARRRR